MTEFKCNLDLNWLQYIEAGLKTVEGRLYKDKFQEMKVGDVIIFNNAIRVQVTALINYNSFRDMLLIEGIHTVLPNIDSVEEGVNVYHKYYSPEKEMEYGVLAIRFQLTR